MLLSQIKQFVRQLPAGRRALVLVWGARWAVANVDVVEIIKRMHGG